jgi:hypothetical protein
VTKESETEQPRFKVYIKPQSFSDCFIATMDPKNPFKICLYPSVNSQEGYDGSSIKTPDEELEQLILYNYLLLKRDCELDF